MPKKRTPKTEPPVTIEWRDPPPKIGRKPVDRPEEIAAGMRIRRALEADRRRRGIPREGTFFPGDDIAIGDFSDKPIKHGTQIAYQTYGCRCTPCRHGHSQRGSEQRLRTRAKKTVQAGAQ